MLSVFRDHSDITGAVKRASAEARADMRRLDSRMIRELHLIFEDTCLQIRDDLCSLADTPRPLTPALPAELKAPVESALVQLRQARDELLQTGLTGAAELAAELWQAAGTDLGVDELVEKAERQIRSLPDDDGLGLADRLVRLDRRLRRRVLEAVMRLLPSTAGTTAKLQVSQVGRVARAVRDILLDGDDAGYDQMLRIVRTATNRAHVLAYRSGMLAHPQVVAERFILSSNHGRGGVRDLHTLINLYGLGAGVYPVGQAPWPEHPNTLNFVEAVFVDDFGKR